MKKRSWFRILSIILTFLAGISAANAQTYNSNADGFNGGYGQVYQSFGLAQATINMQNNTNMQIQKLIMQQAMENKFGKDAVANVQNSGSGSNPQSAKNQTVTPKTSAKSLAFFSPVAKSDNFKIIADEVGKTDEEKTLYRQLFSELAKGFDTEMAPKGRKNNLAAAMTLFIATTVTVFNDDPEPSDAATESLFHALTAMYDETPGMAAVPNKDKQFLHDTFISFSALPLAFYMEAKETKDADLLKLAKVISGALLLDVLKINPLNIRFEGDVIKIKNVDSSNQTKTGDSEVPEKTTAANRNSGITISTTNFDDGWSATPLDEYVRVTKNGVEVRLYFPNAQIDRQRPKNTSTFEPYYWDVFVKPAFNIEQVFVREKEQYSMGQDDNLEAAATDRQTGKSLYVGMGISCSNGSCWTIVVGAPDKNSFYSLFPNDASLKRMLAYNKFGVAQQDLTGKWSSFDAASIQYFNIYSGDLAGMATASTNDSFVFNSNGTYQSEHSGTSTFRGSLSHGKSTYKGTFSVNHWNLNASNRGANDPGEFSCEFQAVKGGFILKLVNKQFTGMAMSLFKTK